MSNPQDRSKDDPPPFHVTGRDGAIDFAAKATSPAVSEQQLEERFCRVLGGAALALWSDLPQGVQEQLFERAVLLGHQSERDEMLREQLAKFLHERHKRTAAHEGSQS